MPTHYGSHEGPVKRGKTQTTELVVSDFNFLQVHPVTGREWCEEENLANLGREGWFVSPLEKMYSSGLCNTQKGVDSYVRLLEV